MMRRVEPECKKVKAPLILGTTQRALESFAVNPTEAWGKARRAVQISQVETGNLKSTTIQYLTPRYTTISETRGICFPSLRPYTHVY